MSQSEFASDVFDSYILSFQEVGDMIKHYANVLSTPLPYKQTPRKAYTPIRRCSRFKKFCRAQTGGGWWDYINSVADRVNFTVNKPVMLHGVQHFGSQGGEYTVYTEVKDSTDGTILVKQSGSFFSEKDDTDWFYGFDVQFDCPVCLVENKEYELVSLIKGPVSWYGEKGQEAVESEGVQFTFRTSYGGNNGTSCSLGQFPAFLIS